MVEGVDGRILLPVEHRLPTHERDVTAVSDTACLFLREQRDVLVLPDDVVLFL